MSHHTPTRIAHLAAAFAIIVSACPGAEYPFHADATKLVITQGDKIVDTQPCERIVLDGAGRWQTVGGYAYIRGQIAQTSDGTLYAQVGGAYGAYWVVKTARNVMFESRDQGRTWQRWNIDLPHERIIGALTALQDDSFLAATTEPGDGQVCYYRSTDRGRTWTQVAAVTPGPFARMSIDGNLLQLHDGTILSVLNFSVPEPDGEHWSLGMALQFILRSSDGGRSWQGGPDAAVWKPLLDAGLIVAPSGPEARIPSGTFPGCYETGIAQAADGLLVAALRFSGPQWPWHKSIMHEWGGRPADGAGRIFRQVMFSTSEDAGRTWAPMRPFADAYGLPVIIQQETNGHLLPLPDGRLVLVHQRRFGPYQLVARLSPDGGLTWLHDEYRLSAGFGFCDNLLLEDGTIVTVTGRSLDGNHQAQVIRWQPPDVEQLRAHGDRQPLPTPEQLARLPVKQGLSLSGVGLLDRALDVTAWHTYQLRLTRADPEQLSPDDRLEVFVDGQKVGAAFRRQLPAEGGRELLFGDNDTSSKQEMATSARYRSVALVPGDGSRATDLPITWSADAADPAPVRQAWSRIDAGSGGGEGPQRDDDGPAWEIRTHANGAIRYRMPLPPTHVADPRGWTLTARFRVTDHANAGSCGIVLRDDQSTFALSLASQ